MVGFRSEFQWNVTQITTILQESKFRNICKLYDRCIYVLSGNPHHHMWMLGKYVTHYGSDIHHALRADFCLLCCKSSNNEVTPK